MIKAALSSPLFRSAGIYTASRIVNAAVPFLMLPILTRYLTPADYGTLALFSVLLGIATPFVGLNLHGAVSVGYFEKSREELARYIGNCLLLMACGAVVLSLLLWPFAGAVGRLCDFPSGWLPAVVAVAAAQFIPLMLLTVWQARREALRYGVFQNLQTAADLSLSVFCIVALGMNWQGRVEGQLAAGVLFAFAALYLLHREKWLSFRYDGSYLREAVRFGLPLIPHALGGLLIVQTDRIFLVKMTGLATAGIYTVGWQFAAAIELLAAAFNQAYAPWLFEKLPQADPAAKREIVRNSYLYFVLILLLPLALSIALPPFLAVFVGRAFAGAANYVFWIALGHAFHGMYYMVANYIFVAGKTAFLAWVTLFTALCNVPCNYLLIKLNGPIGAAQATAIAFFLSFILTWALSARAYPMPWLNPAGWGKGKP